MGHISFIIPTVPVAQPRQRHRVVNTKSGKQFVQNYTPTRDPVNAFKAAVQHAARQAYQGPPLTGPLVAEIIFVMPRGVSKPSWMKKDSNWLPKWKAGERVPYASNRNDRDNLLKSTQDALNDLLWIDDGQLYAGNTEKWIASATEQPHVVVMVTFD